MARETLEEMSMSATLHADKSGTSYTVGKMGSKLKKHGGLKKGEKLSDTHVDDLQDSGVKVKIKPYKQTNEAIQRRMDRLTIIATDPATGRKVIKIAPKKEIEIGKGKQESYEDPIMGVFLNEERFITAIFFLFCDLKPLLGNLRYKGICPPSKLFTATPERDFCPL